MPRNGESSANSRGVSRRSLLQTGVGLAGGVLLPSISARPALAVGISRPAADRHLARRLAGQFGQHRRGGPAHRHLRRPGRRRTQGLAARGRAHQQRQRADQEDLAQDHERRARQASEAAVSPTRPPNRTRRYRPSSASSTRTRSSLMTGATSSRGRRRAEQIRPAREGALRRRHLRFQRHDGQGLRALRLPPVLLWRNGRQRDRPGAAEDVRQEQESRLHDAGLYLRPYGHEVGQ